MGLKWLHNDHTLYILPGLSLPPILLFKEKKNQPTLVICLHVVNLLVVVIDMLRQLVLAK